MKLPAKSLIQPEKLTKYLLTLQKRNDKSKWLAKADYTPKNWQVLENDLRAQILSLDATPTSETKYGQMYEIRGTLTGPDDKVIYVRTIWMTESESDMTKFITMFPDKRRSY